VNALGASDLLRRHVLEETQKYDRAIGLLELDDQLNEELLRLGTLQGLRGCGGRLLVTGGIVLAPAPGLLVAEVSEEDASQDRREPSSGRSPVPRRLLDGTQPGLLDYIVDTVSVSDKTTSKALYPGHFCKKSFGIE
jgi:hypothetical protein